MEQFTRQRLAVVIASNYRRNRRHGRRLWKQVDPLDASDLTLWFMCLRSDEHQRLMASKADAGSTTPRLIGSYLEAQWQMDWWLRRARARHTLRQLVEKFYNSSRDRIESSVRLIIKRDPPLEALVWRNLYVQEQLSRWRLWLPANELEVLIGRKQFALSVFHRICNMLDDNYKPNT